MNVKFFQLIKKNKAIWLTTTIVTIIVTLIRVSGSLQFLELLALDFLFDLYANEQSELKEKSESKIVIVKISEEDLQNLQEYPISDRILAEVLDKIKQQQPSVIGLNLFRDFPVPSSTLNREQNSQAFREIQTIFKNTHNLFGIEKVTQDDFYDNIRPSAIFKELQRTTSADIIVDPDGMIRRGILFPVTDDSETVSIPSMGLALALNYLAEKNINPTQNRDGWLQLKDKVFFPFNPNDGGYINADDRGYQILINWQGRKNCFTEVYLSDILNNNFAADLFRDRIVLIGTTAVSVNDVFYVPQPQNNQATPIGFYGVEIQAYLANYIIDVVLDNKTSIKVLSEFWEYIWLTSNIFIIALWGGTRSRLQKPAKSLLIIACGTLIYGFLISGVAYLAFAQGWWLPIVPTLISVLTTSITIKTYIYIDQLNQAKLNLENQVVERTKELSLKNGLLESTIQQLNETQSQLIAKEKLATLGRISAGIAHEVRNPLNLINLNIQLVAQYIQKLTKKIEDDKLFFEELIDELFADNQDLIWLEKKINLIQQQVTIGEQTIQNILNYTPSNNSNFTLVNITEFIQEIIALVGQEIDMDSFKIQPKIEMDIAREDLEVELIINDFRRALLNIIKNAYDSLQEKSNLDPVFEPIIKITIAEDNSLVKIIIRDNGQGIEQEKIENIFLPFYTQKKSRKGTGLGLFFANEIILGRHKGTIRIDTKVNEYCQFTISLPKNITSQ